MGKIIKNEVEYTRGQMPGYVPVASRAVSDRKGYRLDRRYLKLSNFRTALLNLSDGDGYVEIQDNAGFHNSFYRGRDITDKFNDGSLYTAISSGTFEDLYVGDYFTVTYDGVMKVNRIAGFDIHKNSGDTALSRHTAVIVPDRALTTAAMNSTDSTSGAYKSTIMRTVTLPSIDNKLGSVFGDHLISRRTLVTKTVNASTPSRCYFGISGASSEREWANATTFLMSEVEVFGAISCASSGWDIGIGRSQFPLFRICPEYIILKDESGNKLNYWLVEVASASQFVCVDNEGKANILPASTAAAVRPYWLIG